MLFFPVRISEVNCEDNQRKKKKKCNKKFLAQKSDSCVEVEKSEVKVFLNRVAFKRGEKFIQNHQSLG